MNIKQSIIFLLVVFLIGTATRSSAQSIVSVEKQNGRFQLIRNEKPFTLNGAGAESYFAELAAAGGNSFRTWGADELPRILDEAQKHGLTVCAGLWLGHQRHGFDYQNQKSVLKQLDETLDVVRKNKDHPALLMWGVGNEMEGHGKDPSVWYAVNHVAREIKRIDPNHPTMTVIAELGENEVKVQGIERFCPDIDIIGINSYGGVESVGKRYRKAGGSKPFIITEHGPLGPWEVGKTSWGSPMEWSSTEKAAFYKKGYEANVIKQSDLCLGSYAFLWGHKQETTATWFGMLLPNGSRLAAADVMSEFWKGSPVKNRCPEIKSIKLDRSGGLKPGDTIAAVVEASDPENDPLTIKWILRSDSGTIGDGGDPQESETAYRDAVKSSGAKATVTIPDSGGGYRLFAYVLDNHNGAAVANIPFRIAAPIKLASVMPVSKLPYVVHGDGAKESVFIPSGYMGNAASVSMELDCREKPNSGATCMKAEYKSSTAWGGVLWQSPAEDWDGKQPGGANLTGATHLEFYARGDQGGEKVNFVFGVLDGNQPYRDTAKGELNDVTLTTKWQRFSFPLNDLDLRQIKTGFGWSLAGQGKPVTFYLDDIRYIGE